MTNQCNTTMQFNFDHLTIERVATVKCISSYFIPHSYLRHNTETDCLLCPSAASAHIPLLTPKEEPGLEGSRASSEQGEEEMEGDSNDEQDGEGDTKAGGGASFQTLSTLSSLRPGACGN